MKTNLRIYRAWRKFHGLTIKQAAIALRVDWPLLIAVEFERRTVPEWLIERALRTEGAPA